MTLSIRYRGAGRYSLALAGNEIGTIHGRLLRIGGFDTEEEAAAARHAGFVALLRWVALRPGASRPPEVERGIEDADRDVTGAGTAAVAGSDGEGSVVARLVRPDAQEQGEKRGGAYAAEFRLPSGLFTAVALHAAQSIYGAIRDALEEREPRRGHGSDAAMPPGGVPTNDARLAAAT